MAVRKSIQEKRPRSRNVSKFCSGFLCLPSGEEKRRIRVSTCVHVLLCAENNTV